MKPEQFKTAAELQKEIAELKIRLAFQQEAEEETEKAECLSGTTEDAATEVIEEEYRKRILGRKKVRIAIAMCLLLLLSFSSAIAFSPKLSNVISELFGRMRTENTQFTVVQYEKPDVPAEWAGYYFPTYIPEGFLITDDISWNWIMYRDANGNVLKLQEGDTGSTYVLDTENARISTADINGRTATVVEKERYTTIIWQIDMRFFVITLQGGEETALKIARSVVMYK